MILHIRFNARSVLLSKIYQLRRMIILDFLNKYVIIIVIAMSFVSCCDFNYFSEILDLSPECADAGTFPAPRKKSDKSAHRLQQGVIL